MKRLLPSLFTGLLLAAGQTFAQGADAVNLQDSTGLPGDNFSLEGALQQFREASSMEDFELRLNTEANAVNNLDLNQDGEIDYIRVEDHAQGDAHAIVLQVPVNDKESQDIAVIELEKTGEATAIVQIIGDEEIYGEQKIVEPFDETETPKGGGRGPSVPEIDYVPVVVNVWLWPSVRFVYGPAYRPYVSPWYWRHYPATWHPWHPHPWRHHWAMTHPYLRHHHVVATHRVVVAHGIYTPHRHTSVVVVNHYRPARDHYRANRVTVVKGPRGHTKAVVVHRGRRR